MLNLSADAANKFLHINSQALITITIIISHITKYFVSYEGGVFFGRGGGGVLCSLWAFAQVGVAANARLSLGD